MTFRPLMRPLKKGIFFFDTTIVHHEVTYWLVSHNLLFLTTSGSTTTVTQLLKLSVTNSSSFDDISSFTFPSTDLSQEKTISSPLVSSLLHLFDFDVVYCCLTLAPLKLDVVYCCLILPPPSQLSSFSGTFSIVTLTQGFCLCNYQACMSAFSTSKIYLDKLSYPNF